MAKRYLIVEIEDTVPEHQEDKYLGRWLRHLHVVYGPRTRAWKTTSAKSRKHRGILFKRTAEVFPYEDKASQ